MSLHVPWSRETERSLVDNKRSRLIHAGARTRIFIVIVLSLAAFYASATAPSLTGAGTVSYPEGAASIVVATGLNVTDPDLSIASATVQIVGSFSSSEDALTFTPSGGIVGSYNGATGLLTLTGVVTPGAYQTVLRTVRFANTTASPAIGTRTIEFTVNDGTSPSNIITRTVLLSDAPVLSGLETATINYAEDDPAVLVTNSISISDIDNTTLTGATVSMSSPSPFTYASDILAATNAFGITSVYSPTTGVLTLTGTGTLAEYQSVLRSVTYQNLFGPLPSRTINFRVTDGVAQSSAASRTINIITQVNDAPVISGVPATNAVFLEAAVPSAVTIASTIAVTDLDNINIASAQVAITRNLVPTEDVLTFTPFALVDGTYDPSTGIISLTGVGTTADYVKVLKTVKYSNTNALTASPLTRTISFTVSDGALTSNPVTRNVVVTTTKETLATTEEVPLNIPLLVYNAAINANIDLSTFTVTTAPANGSVTIDNTTGIITYTPNAEFNTTGSITETLKVTVNDINGVTSGVLYYSITVALVNDPPSFTMGSDITVLEDMPLQTYNGWATDLEDGDPYNNQTFTFVITTSADSLFQNKPAISSAGNLTLRPKANLSGTATVSVYVKDNGSNTLPNVNYSDTKTFIVTILSVNDAPVASNDTYSTSSVAALSASVRTTDVEKDSIVLSTTPVIPPAHGSVVLQPSGTFVYTPDPSYTGTDSFTYEVCDDGNDNGAPAPRCAQATISITVNPVNSDWNIVGNNSIELSPNSFILTQDIGTQQGAIWNKNPLDLRYSFDLNLNAIFSAEGVVKDSAGADGMVFAFQRDFTPPPLNVPNLPIFARGDTGGSLGVGSISPSFHVEVDTYMNAGDPWYDHISIGTNGNVWNYVGGPVAAVIDGTNHAVNIEDGVWHSIRILWDNPSKKLIVYFDGVQKLVVTNDIANQVFGNDPSNVYWGFTASTGGKSNYQALKDVVMTVTNLPPDIGADVATVDEDAVLTGTSLIDNDTDPEGTVLAITPETKPTAHGEVVINPDGTFIYTPVADYNGNDSFTYQVCDSYSSVECSTGVVNITVNPVQDAPVASDDVFSTLEDTKLEVTCYCVLINDVDVDGDPLTGNVVQNVTHGTLTFQPDGTFEYMPDQDFFGVDTFTYTATDGYATTPPALVTINVIPVNDPPVAANDVVTVVEDIPSPLAILANDKDVDDVLSTSMITVTTPPLHGTLQITPQEIVYTPQPDYYGPDTFEYILTDAAGAPSNTATVSIDVTPVNDVPIAVADAATTPEDTPATISVLLNDTDVDNALDPASIITTTPAHGSVKANTDGTIVYSPSKDYFGPDSFTYTVRDVAGGTSLPATVSLTVTPVNDAPVASNDEGNTLENTPVDVPLTDNDNDVDNPVDPTSVIVVDPPKEGTVSVSPGGVATYVPNADYLGEDTFTYTIHDPDGLISEPTVVTVTIIPPNRAPVAINDGPVTHRFLLDLPIDVLANDYDVDNDHNDIIIQSVTQPNMGMVSVVGSNLVYHPEGNSSGTVTFTYTIADPAGLTATATVTIEYVYNPLTVSEGFSPNSDNSNDTWYILSIENFPDNQVKVFDRWGLLVYQKTSYENMLAPWDGRGNVGQQSGKLLDQGTYYYMLDVGGEVRTLSGFVMITR